MRLPVLMYHTISRNDKPGRHNVTPERLESHFNYLSEQGFTTISLDELIANVIEGKELQRKPILLTFDDGHKSHFSELYPLLLKYNFKAVIFLTASYIRTTKNISHWDHLNMDEIRIMQKDHVEYGLHTFDHRNYDHLSSELIEEDIYKTKEYLLNLNIPFKPCFAYSYGAFSRKDKVKREIITKIFEKEGMQLAFRIGNRINRLPFKNNFLIQRIDIRGSDPFWKFKLMCRFGRKYLPF